LVLSRAMTSKEKRTRYQGLRRYRHFWFASLACGVISLIDVPPSEIAARAHSAFEQDQAAIAPLAAQVAQASGFQSSDYRAVIAELKKRQITGPAIVPFFENRLHEIERIIRTNDLVALPDRSVVIRLASAAETACSALTGRHRATLNKTRRSAG
jgi:hypothetical protein